MKQMPLVSVIVPVYNVEKYLEKCLDSILDQTYQNLEIVCVNDGSQDGSGEILKQYAEKDSRIKLFYQENHGASVARNYALDEASGEYIMFVDGDDWIDKDTCQTAIDYLLKHDADVVLWDYISERGEVSRPKKIYDEDRFFNKDAIQTNFHRRLVGLVGQELLHPEQSDGIATVWGKLYKRKCIYERNIRFYDIRKIGSYEDGLFNLCVFEGLNKVVYIHRHFYHYRRDNENSVTSAFRETLQEQHEELHQYMRDYIDARSMDDSYYLALSNRMALELVGYGLNILISKRRRIKQIKTILNNPYYKEAYKNLQFRYMPLHWKLFYGCARINFATGVYVLLCIIKKIIKK